MPTPPAPPVATASLALVAGHAGGPGTVDGIGSIARFSNLQGLVVDGGGNVLVASGCAIRKITPDWVVTTFANGVCSTPGGVDPSAILIGPSDLGIDASGNVYVLDMSNIVRKISPSGAVTTLLGSYPAPPNFCPPRDGPLATATLCYVDALTTDGAGNVITSGLGGIRKISAAGIVSTIGGVVERSTLATDALGNIYVADGINDTISVLGPSGALTTVAGVPGLAGSNDGPVATARFMRLSSVTTDLAGNIYAADSTTIRKITPGGQVTTLAGLPGTPGSDDGTGSAARFGLLLKIGADRSGNIYVADSDNDDIRRVTPAGVVTTIAGAPPVRGSSDGVGDAATMAMPAGIAADGAGNLYVTDGAALPGGQRHLRKVSPGGQVTTLDSLRNPSGIAVDSSGNIFFSDSSCFLVSPPVYVIPGGPPCNGTVKKMAPNGGPVTIFAGQDGVSGSSDGAGSAASFVNPTGLAADSTGNLWVVDRGAYTIRRISPGGVVTTVAGSPGLYGYVDGIGSAARFRDPGWIAADRAGNAYVTEGYDGVIRRVTPSGEVTTLVAQGALQTGIAGIVADDQGNLYVAGQSYSVIYKVTPAGSVSTIAGVAGQDSFQPGPLPGRVFHPIGLAISGSDLYMTLGDGVAVIHDQP
jgi:sugar lactone lactonase YvrE